MKRLILGVAIILSIGFVMNSCKEHKKAHEEVKEKHDELNEKHDELAEIHVFQCPMDCEKGKTYEEKGSCPVCKMALKENEGSEESEAKLEEGEDHDEKEENHEN